jgi:LacI family transcriptional regulator
MPADPSTPSRATIYDVAEAAGVAISTVSRVLNHSPEVSDATRARVDAAVRKLRFQPQRNARTLASQNTTALAVALPSATSQFYVEILKGVKDVLRTHDYDLLLCNLGSVHPDSTLSRFMDRGAVDGLLLTSLDVDADLAERLHRLHAPVVLLGGRAVESPPADERPDFGFDTFWWDDRAGARRATEHLIELGHRRIGMITSQPWSLSAGPRQEGFADAHRGAGLSLDPDLVATASVTKHAGYSEEAGAEAMAQLLALPEPPTAVFAASDVQAFGAWAYARDNGVRIPRDLALVGYDDLKLSRFLDLTTVSQGMHEAGRLATERLLSRIETPTAERVDVQMETPLVVRGSTASPS